MALEQTDILRISDLIFRSHAKQLHEWEQAELDNWLQTDANIKKIFEDQDDLKQVKQELNIMNAFDADLSLNTFHKRHRQVISVELWPRIALAAAAIAAIVFGVWFFSVSRHSDTGHHLTLANKDDVAPGKNRATLILADGKSITLSDAKTGIVINNAKLTYNDGTALGASGNGQLDPVTGQVQTIATPPGGTYQITLSDGTKVWLNAASSLTYTATLKEGGERRVKLIGEGYFEVTKDKKHPFVVSSKGQDVRVLGTRFNINSYTDEPFIATTLIEGSVKVKSGKQQHVIVPGEQLVNNGSDFKVTKVNTADILDWKEGEFNLEGLPFRMAMRKIARWYSVEVIYNPSVPDDILSGGWISRDVKLSTILRGIELSKQASFKLRGRKLYVSKYN